MRRPLLHSLLLAVLLALATGPAVTQEKKEPAPDKLSETPHVLKMGMETIEYKATAGTLTLKEEDGKPLAQPARYKMAL